MNAHMHEASASLDDYMVTWAHSSNRRWLISDTCRHLTASVRYGASSWRKKTFPMTIHIDITPPYGPLIGRIHLISYWLLGTIWRWKNSLRGLLRWRRINGEREENCSRWCKCGASPTLPTPSSILASSIGTYNCCSSSSSSPSSFSSNMGLLLPYQHHQASSSLCELFDNFL